MGKYSEICFCRNLVCAITFLTIGISFVVAGAVLAAVGFGTWPKDMFDTKNLSMRVVGLVLVGAGVLPIIMGALFAFFFCANRSGKFPGQKKNLKNDVELSVISKPKFEYSYPTDGSSMMYKPVPMADDSLVKYVELEKDHSFTAPLNNSGKSFNNGGMDSPIIYSEVKELEMDGTKTRTTTTTTRVYKTEMFDNNRVSGSSGATMHSENLPSIKAKPAKKHSSSATGSDTSGIPSFNEGDIPLQQKAKRPKKHKKKEHLEWATEEVDEDMEEPLPGGRYRSDGSDSTDARKPVPKPRSSAASTSFEDDNNLAPPVYSKVSKKRQNKA